MLFDALLYTAGFGAIIALALFLVKSFTKHEQRSDFFQEAVETEYSLEFPDDEKERYYEMKTKICAFLDGFDQKNKEEQKMLFTKLKQNEQKVLLMTLKKVMVRCIANLAKLQKDKPGNYQLWRGKLISEKFWQSLVECENEVNADIEECMLECNRIIGEGHADDFFNDALEGWRQEVASAQLSKLSAQKAELEKREKKREEGLEKQRKHNEEMAKLKAEKEKLKAEEDEQRLLEQMLCEDDEDNAQAGKKGKKGKSVVAEKAGGPKGGARKRKPVK